MSNIGSTKDLWTEKWDERYRQDEFAYGEHPNSFLKEQLQLLNVGKILFPAEGEGRNAVYAAKKGWDVTAFDISHEGKRKASVLADKNNVTIDYRLGSLEIMQFQSQQFDALALIFAHFPANIKSNYHQTLDNFLKINGTIIFEAFSKKHLDYIIANPKVGGPKDIESLFSIEEIKKDFPNYTFLILEEKEIELNEGIFHNGKGSVIRFVAQKTKQR